jgi:hypothetical protein
LRGHFRGKKRDRKESMRADWLAIGTMCRPISRGAAAVLCKTISMVKSVLRGTALVSEWRRYRVDLNGAFTSPTMLVPLTEELMSVLRTHPDREQLGTTFHLWDTGFRTALVCMDHDRPFCIQWLLTAAENHLLPKLGQWSGLYPPLPPATGQVEGLYAFKDSRGTGVATDFAFAMNEHARLMGLEELVTHIAEENKPAHKWAQRTGWAQSGTITRLQLDVLGLRNVTICVHCSAPSPVNPQH